MSGVWFQYDTVSLPNRDSGASPSSKSSAPGSKIQVPFAFGSQLGHTLNYFLNGCKHFGTKMSSNYGSLFSGTAVSLSLIWCDELALQKEKRWH